MRELLTSPPHRKQMKLLPSAKASSMICFLPLCASMEASFAPKSAAGSTIPRGGTSGGGPELMGRALSIAHWANKEASWSTVALACCFCLYSSRARHSTSKTAWSPHSRCMASVTCNHLYYFSIWPRNNCLIVNRFHQVEAFSLILLWYLLVVRPYHQSNNVKWHMDRNTIAEPFAGNKFTWTSAVRKLGYLDMHFCTVLLR